MVVSDWKAFEKGTFRGFFKLTLPSGLIVNDVTVHGKNGARWIGELRRETRP
jgi:hypothetical protein